MRLICCLLLYMPILYRMICIFNTLIYLLARDKKLNSLKLNILFYFRRLACICKLFKLVCGMCYGINWWISALPDCCLGQLEGVCAQAHFCFLRRQAPQRFTACTNYFCSIFGEIQKVLKILVLMAGSQMPFLPWVYIDCLIFFLFWHVMSACHAGQGCFRQLFFESERFFFSFPGC